MAVQDLGTILKTPKNLIQHILIVVLVALLFACIAIYFFDQKLATLFADATIKSTWYQPARKLTDLGLFELYFTFAICTWAYAKWIGPRRQAKTKQKIDYDFMRRWGVNFINALLISGILTHLIKFIAGRQRPHKSLTLDPLVFEPFNTHWHWQSFSSGHTQVVFTVATMMFVAIPKWKWLWFTLAALIGFTRVMVTDHFLSDIIFGACVGYVGTLLTLYLMQKKTPHGLF